MAGRSRFLLFPYFKFQSRNSRPYTSLHAERRTAREWEKEEGKRRAIHICRSEIRTPPPSIPRLEVIITYIRQLTRVRPSRRLGSPRRGNPRTVELQAVPDTISRCADRAVMVRAPLLFYIVSAVRFSLYDLGLARVEIRDSRVLNK